MQSLQVNIQIPDDLVLIKKVEYERFLADQLHGRYWDIEDLEAHVKKNYRWIRKHILMNPMFRRKLDVNYGGFVSYPEKGEHWSFHAVKMSQFLDENFHTIFGGTE